MIREITSTTNPLIKQLRALMRSKKERQQSGTFIIEGWRGIDTLLTHKSEFYRLERIVVSSAWREDPRLPSDLEIVVLPDFVFEKISDVKNAQGILGVVRYRSAPFHFLPDTGRYLVLDALRDPGNLGTLIRSAVGAGFDGILLYGDGVDRFNPKVIRATMGTFAYIPIWPVLRSDMERLQHAGYALLATTGREGESLYHARFSKKLALMVGSEAHGVSSELMQLASLRLTIPLVAECESLNAAIAGSICMFHIQASRDQVAGI